MEFSSMEKMYSDHDQENITTDENNNSIYFNAGINPKSMSILIDSLINLEQKILKKKKKIKKKIFRNKKKR